MARWVKDFIPSVAPIFILSLASEEEEEDEMTDLIHNFGVGKCKQGASFNRIVDATLEAMGEADQHSADGGSRKQVIVAMDSPEMGFHGQPVVETAYLSNFEEVPSSHEEAQGDIPSK